MLVKLHKIKVDVFKSAIFLNFFFGISYLWVLLVVKKLEKNEKVYLKDLFFVLCGVFKISRKSPLKNPTSTKYVKRKSVLKLDFETPL